MDDRELRKLREIGEANRVTLELLRNWCAHARVVTEGGVGMFQQFTGLPVSMCRVTCEHERAGSQVSMHLKENALDFHDRNCFDCEHREPVGFPNLSFLVGERDRERQDRARRAEETKRRRDEELEARCRRRAAVFESPNAAQRGLVELLDELDRSPSEATEHAFLEALRAVPDQVTDRFRESVAEVVAVGGMERARAGLKALEQLQFDGVELARFALDSISRNEAVEEAAEIAARHLTSEHREALVSVGGAILLLAEPMIGSVFDRFRSSHPNLFLRANSVAPDVVRAAIHKALASESKGMRSAGCSAIALLMDANEDAGTASSLAESLVRSLSLPDDHYDGGSAGARASWVLAELLRRSPESVGVVLQTHAEDPQDVIRCGVFQALIEVFRARDLATGRITREEREPQENPGPAEAFAFSLVIEAVSRIPSDDRLSRAVEFFRARGYEGIPWKIAAQHVPTLLGTAAIASDRAERVGEASPLLEDPRPDPLKALERQSSSIQLRSLARELAEFVAWLCQRHPAFDERNRLVGYFLETMRAVPRHADGFAAILLAQLGKLSRPREVLPDLYSAMTHESVRVRSAASAAYVELCDSVSPDSLPNLLHETFLILLSDPFVAVHKAALQSLSRLRIPEHHRVEAFNRVGVLLSVYAREGDDPYFLADVLDQVLRLVPADESLAPRVRQEVLRIARTLPPEAKHSLLRGGTRTLRETPGYGDLLLDLPITGDWGDYGSERVVEELRRLPRTEVERIAERMVEVGTLVARHRPLAVQPLLELLNWSGCPQEARTLAEAAVEACGPEQSRMPQRLQLEIYSKAMEIEEALGRRSPEIQRLLEEFGALQEAIREDTEVNRSRRGLNDFPPV